MWMCEEVSLLANADMHRNTGDEDYQLLVGRDANTSILFFHPGGIKALLDEKLATEDKHIVI